MGENSSSTRPVYRVNICIYTRKLYNKANLFSAEVCIMGILKKIHNL